MGVLIVLVIIVFGIILFVATAIPGQNKKEDKAQEQRTRSKEDKAQDQRTRLLDEIKISSAETIEFEKGCFAYFITGFRDYSNSRCLCGYFVSSRNYIFYNCVNYEEIGRIPRDGIYEAEILDQATFTKKIEMGALILLGPFGLGAQSTEEHIKYHLVVKCRDFDNENLVLLFEGISEWGSIGHIKALEHTPVADFNEFLSHKFKYQERLSSAEKRCPFCAEVIKSAAIKCRYCGSDLTAQ